MSESRTPTVLVADDDAATRYIVRRTLAHEGFSVLEAASGRDALDAFASASPDVILLDVEMPNTDGYAACSEIRASTTGKDVPIIMVTSNDDPESINRAYRAGATDFIAKPINWSLIGHRVRYILRGARNFQALCVSEAEKRALLAAMPDRIFVVEADGTIVTHLHGGDSHPSDEAVTGGRLQDVFPAGLDADVGSAIDAALSTGGTATVEYCADAGHDDADGVCWQESRFVHHGDQRVLVIDRDISERKSAERKIHSLAYYDDLTGLPNRPLFNDELVQLLARARESDSFVAVLNIDLDRFKRINDTLGTAAGDRVLVEMAMRLSTYAELLRQRHFNQPGEIDARIACLGGDEFALVVATCTDRPDILSIADELRTALAEPVVVRGHEFVVTASVGVACYPDQGSSVDELLKNAGSARHEAKRLGSNTQRLYQSSMSSDLNRCLSIETELRSALANGELTVFYQPKHCPSTHAVHGAEAVLRWFHPTRGEIPPMAFIPIAEESGLIADIGVWLAQTVCEQISAWRYFDIETGPIAINVSGQEFGVGDPSGTLGNAIRQANIPASALEIEITETVLMSDIRSVLATLNALREEGFTLAVDDFGTGYSSLRYLQRFPVDVLKIDSSFVRDLEKDTDSRAICAAIIAMARSLGLKVVGEGVETKWQLEYLRRQRCDLVQGFLLSKPVDADAFVDIVKKSAPADAADDRVVHIASHSRKKSTR